LNYIKEKTENAMAKFKFDGAMIKNFKEEFMPALEPLMV
jgi:hypothetical protein